MPNLEERSALFAQLSWKKDTLSPAYVESAYSSRMQADVLSTNQLRECYRIADCACKALHPSTYPTPEVMDDFLISVFRNWPINEELPNVRSPCGTPLAHTLFRVEAFIPKRNLIFRVATQSQPIKVIITVQSDDDPNEWVGKECWKVDTGEEVMEELGHQFMEAVHAYNSTRALGYAWLYLSGQRLAGEAYDFSKLEDATKLLPERNAVPMDRIMERQTKWVYDGRYSRFFLGEDEWQQGGW
ncbi:hypothetical protein N3K66_006421 [Trichothecium roseum]|uniref:Uncharacterized protein n=1 Tax=Trichothecium roseum TaxID=47278 RepID=A0ACC0UVC3_9HYPO|nr:hypothetical protein N3K66_006421 [Trichothecium roseum]